MRAAPALQISLRHFGVWRLGVGLVAASGVAALTAWLVSHAPATSAALMLAVGAIAAAIAWLTFSLARLPALGLRWDGQCWHLGAPGATADDSVPGELAVAIDLGPWMLLHFSPLDPRQRALVSWIPAQKRGAEKHWHALRCAVHSPQAPAGVAPER